MSRPAFRTANDGAPPKTIANAQPNAGVDHYGDSIGRNLHFTLTDAVAFNGCTTNSAKNDAEPETGLRGELGNIFVNE